MNEFNVFPDDVIIAVMGPTGSGKTNFINALTGNHEKATVEPQDVNTVSRDGLRVVLVEIPAFDHIYRSDLDVLKSTVEWLTKEYPDGNTLRLSGVIYLHRITDNRMAGVSSRNLEIFGRLCGNMPLRRVRLVTTMWDVAHDFKIAENREKELIDDFWRLLVQGGACAQRFENTAPSAWQIVDELIAIEGSREALLLQEEIVERRRPLNETKVGKLLCSYLQRRMSEQRRTLVELAYTARSEDNPALVQSLQEEHEQVSMSLQQMVGEMNALKISPLRLIPGRLLGWGWKKRGHAIKPERTSRGSSSESVGR